MGKSKVNVTHIALILAIAAGVFLTFRFHFPLEYSVISGMGWGKCPLPGMTDCPTTIYSLNKVRLIGDLIINVIGLSIIAVSLVSIIRKFMTKK